MTETTFSDMRRLSGAQARALIRRGAYSRHTAGLASGYLQANLVILPEDYALDFMRFCQRNPKPCPLVGVSDTGNPFFETLGEDIDARFDVPSYNVYRDGELIEQRAEISELWEDRQVAFALGCSFTFEAALIAHGIPVWHVSHDRTVPMFRSSLPLTSAGPFGGSMVVSMRSIAESKLDDVIRISRHFPLAHGAPVHLGDPDAIGIEDIARPDWGDPAPVEPGHVTSFWACGVTPQAVVRSAGIPLVITHTPGHMLITDVPEDAEVPVITPQHLHS